MKPMVPLQRVLDMLPKFMRNRAAGWRVTGDRTQTNAQLLPAAAEKSIRKLMAAVDRQHFRSTVKYVDVSGNEIWVLHRHLVSKTLYWLAKRDWYKLQQWPRSKLPIYVLWKDRTIVWNGTHRMTLGRLLGRKVRARVFDLNVFAEWSKTHPYGWDAKVVRPRVKARKARKRGHK